MSTRYVMTPNDLARAVFVQNARNGRIYLDFPTGPRTPRDTFNFLLDLFLKGLVLLYGDATGRLDVQSLESEQVAYAVERMRLVGVETTVTVVPAPTTAADTDRDAYEHAESMLEAAGARLAAAPAAGTGAQSLEDLDFTIRSRERIVQIRFRC